MGSVPAGVPSKILRGSPRGGAAARPEAVGPEVAAAARERRLNGWAAAIVGALLASFVLLATTAARDKSATYDEALHLVGGYVHRYEHDYRINPEDPPLFGMVAALPLARGAMVLDKQDPSYATAVTDVRYQWKFAEDTLFRTGNDAIHLLGTARLSFVSVGMALGALVALWAWMLGGRWAGVGAAAFFCLDPNFLAHSSIVKNDVLLSTVLTALSIVVWRLGVRGRWYWIVALALLCGAAINAKFSGILAAPIVGVALLVRALLPQAWTVLGFELRTRLARVAALVPIGLLAMVTAWAVTWAAYGFRFSATADGQSLNTAQVVELGRMREWRAAHNGEREPTPAELSLMPMSLPMRVIGLIESNRLLPQGWTFGFLYTYSTTLIRSSFLLGNFSTVGFRWFFPLAMLFKTPVASIVALVGALVLAIIYMAGGGRRPAPAEPEAADLRGGAWAAIAWGTAPAIYMASALATNLNLGLRHVLPVYPFLFVAIGVAAAAAVRHWPRWGAIAVGVLWLGLAAETIGAYPDYLAFFNVACGGSRGGIRLLSDSNLDWGQDMPAVAEWQKDHPDVQLYLCYFGRADPEYYGLRCMMVPDTLESGRVRYPLPGVLAISATALQGTYTGGKLAEAVGLKDPPREPIAVLHGTIYLYDVK